MDKLNYITPQVWEYNNLDDMLKNTKHRNSYYNNENQKLSIPDIINKKFVCIVGEPGVGKSRLLYEIKLHINGEYISSDAASFHSEMAVEDKKYCIIDALDEVNDGLFFHKLQEIKKFRVDHPDIKIIFSCRRHYVASNASHFSFLTDISYIEIERLSNNDVDSVINNRCSATTKESIDKSPKLRELLSIPRYLVFLLELEKEKGECNNLDELFDYIVTASITKTIEDKKDLANNDNNVILIKRSLEKVALVMEIGRRDYISKDELYTILDGLKGNMAQMLIANFDLLFFENRILKCTGNNLQFHNGEIQEYLAAKELCRQSNIESFLYDVAVHKDLKHISTNWYDVIPHISYSLEGAETLISIIKLIIGYEDFLENESFESLLRYIDPAILTQQKKGELFSLLLDHYLKVPAYIRWQSNVYNLFAQCFTPSCTRKLIRSYKLLSSIHLQNMQTILEAVQEENELDNEVRQYWREAANFFMSKDEEEYKLTAIRLYGTVKDIDGIISLSENFKDLSRRVKEEYCDVTRREQWYPKEIIDCWLEECFIGNPHAVQAILSIKDLEALAYAYLRIVNAKKLGVFFSPSGSLVVFFDWLLPEQFMLVQTGSEEIKLLFLNVLASYVNHRSSHSCKEVQKIIKKLFLNKDIGERFVSLIENQWDLENVLNHFDIDLIDGEFINCVDELLHLCGYKDWIIESILKTLTFRICEDKSKKDSVIDYISRYSDTFKKWEETSKASKQDSGNSKLIMAYEELSNQDIPACNKYGVAELLARHIGFLTQFDICPFVEVASSFLEHLNLDKESINRTSANSFSFTYGLWNVPTFVLALHQLGQLDLLSKHRILLAKILPLACWHNNDSRTIRRAYKEIISELSEEEKKDLIEWWKARQDDFMNISHKDILNCITEYGIDVFSYKLEEYIQTYVENPIIDHFLAAKDSFDLIAQGYCNWDLKQFESLFNSLKEEDEEKDYGINEIKLECNAIMISKFQDKNAIKWRIDYLRRHIFKSSSHNAGHVRPISEREIEVTSSNPYMFRCFMEISNNSYLDEQMMNLFEFGLSLSSTKETKEYSNYLLRQIYLFFISTGTMRDLQKLRKITYNIHGEDIPFYVFELMNRAEIRFMNQNIIPITKSLLLYNRSLEQPYLEIRNDGDLCRYFDNIFYEVQREIQDVGIYSFFKSRDINENFIQRELKNTIINVGCRMGLELRLDREVTLQDDKRTDVLLWYGMCHPIMIELKLLNNNEIQNDTDRKQYKKKFLQYIEATRPCMAVYWVFNVNKPKSDIEKFKELEHEYSKLPQTRVVLTDCKCNSAEKISIETPKTANKSNKNNSKRTSNKKS